MSKETEESKFEDFDNIFDAVIKDGYVSNEEEIIPGLKIKLRALTPNEMFKVENEINKRNPDVPEDITVKLRCAKILSYAVLTLNGSTVVDEDMDHETASSRRLALYIKFVKSPPIIVQKAYDLYYKTVIEENKYYDFPKEVGDAIENFSERTEEK